MTTARATLLDIVMSNVGRDEPVDIVIPMQPPRECSPNHRGHWRYRQQATRVWRDTAYLAAMADRLHSEVNLDNAGPVVMDITVYWYRNRKRMDSDNLIAACKPARDGIADALFGGDDSRIQVGTVTQERGSGVTVITLRSAA